MNESLRDTISALTDKAEAGEPLTEVKTPEPAIATETPETEEQKAG